MSRRFLAVFVLLSAACGAPRVPERLDRPAEPVVEAPRPVERPNLELAVSEVVPNADDEGIAYTILFVEGAPAAKTPVGPRSAERRVLLRLPAGNHLVRLEHWSLPPVGDWERLPGERQPRERFVRVDDESLTRLSLRYDADGRPSLSVERLPAAP
jgi:hypothetical protein